MGKGCVQLVAEPWAELQQTGPQSLLLPTGLEIHWDTLSLDLLFHRQIQSRSSMTVCCIPTTLIELCSIIFTVDTVILNPVMETRLQYSNRSSFTDFWLLTNAMSPLAYSMSSTPNLWMCLLSLQHLPIVRSCTGWNLLSVNCSNKHDLPAPEN